MPHIGAVKIVCPISVPNCNERSRGLGYTREKADIGIACKIWGQLYIKPGDSAIQAVFTYFLNTFCGNLITSLWPTRQESVLPFFLPNSPCQPDPAEYRTASCCPYSHCLSSPAKLHVFHGSAALEKTECLITGYRGTLFNLR